MCRCDRAAKTWPCPAPPGVRTSQIQASVHGGCRWGAGSTAFSLLQPCGLGRGPHSAHRGAELARFAGPDGQATWKTRVMRPRKRWRRGNARRPAQMFGL